MMAVIVSAATSGQLGAINAVTRAGLAARGPAHDVVVARVLKSLPGAR